MKIRRNYLKPSDEHIETPIRVYEDDMSGGDLATIVHILDVQKDRIERLEKASIAQTKLFQQTMGSVFELFELLAEQIHNIKGEQDDL